MPATTEDNRCEGRPWQRRVASAADVCDELAEQRLEFS
jgi:hypothetical protein